MLTPPASPVPQRNQHDHQHADPSSASSSSSPFLSPSRASTPPSPPCSFPSRSRQLCSAELHHKPLAAERRVGHRTRWTILLVPVVLVLITLSTRYLSHPAALDALSPDRSAHDWATWATTLSNWQPHKRHPQPDPSPQAQSSQLEETISFPASISSTLDIASTASGSSLTEMPTSSGSASPASPTIPAVLPTLPTPFPQPLDTTLSQNFSTQSCQQFFLNMTQTDAFRECRSFAMLLQSSSAFIQAQKNISLLNTVVWGTCNTVLSEDQCIANMAWFAETMQTSCATELKLSNVMATTTLQGLQLYTLMRTTACLANATTDTYCYIDAVSSGNPADVYFYSLPLGIALPNSSVPSCSRCTQQTMEGYVSVLGNFTGLQATYEHAAEIANGVCGQGYVQQIATPTKNAAAPSRRAALWAVLSLAIATLGTLVS